MKARWAVFALSLAVGLTGCTDTPVAPDGVEVDHRVMMQNQGQGPPVGTGLILESITGASAPVVGELGTVTIDEAIITDLAIIEDAAGAIIGLEASGLLTASGGVLGDEVVTEEFTTTVGIVSGGPGRCEIVGVDLGPIELDAAFGIVEVDVPEAEVAGRGSGALGSLLCTLGGLLDPVTGAVSSGVRALVDVINNLLI